MVPVVGFLDYSHDLDGPWMGENKEGKVFGRWWYGTDGTYFGKYSPILGAIKFCSSRPPLYLSRLCDQVHTDCPFCSVCFHLSLLRPTLGR